MRLLLTPMLTLLLSESMKYFILCISVMIGTGLVFGKLASDFIDYEQQRNMQKQCELIENFRPECKSK